MAAVNRAVVLHERGDTPRWSVEERPVPTANEGSVVVRMLHGATVQYSKMQLTNKGYPVPLPFTPGANGVGRVHAIGQDCTTLRTGDLVLVNSVITPRDSQNDRLLFTFATDGSAAASHLMEGCWRDGTYQQYARLPLENVFRLDEERLCGELGYQIGHLSLIQTCAVAYGGLVDANLKAGDTVIVAPSTGRFSGATVLTALAMGARVIAAGRRQEALDELVSAMGTKAHLKVVLLTGDTATDSEAFKTAAGKNGADVYVDWSPPAASTPGYLTAALGAMRRKGAVMLMGGIAADISLPYLQIMLKCLRVQGRFMYEPDGLQQCIKLAEAGILPLGPGCGMKIAASYGLDEFGKALEKASEFPGWGSVVEIVP